MGSHQIFKRKFLYLQLDIYNRIARRSAYPILIFMRLTLKIVLAMYFGFLLVLLIDGYRNIRKKVKERIAVQLNNQEMLGLAFTPTLARIWRMEGELPAKYLVNYIQQLNKNMNIRLVYLGKRVSAHQRPRAVTSRINLNLNHPVQSVTQGDKNPMLLTYALIPTGKPEARTPAIELSTFKIYWRSRIDCSSSKVSYLTTGCENDSSVALSS